jgi:hypothetical protein
VRSVSSLSATTGASCCGTRTPDDKPPAFAWEVFRAPLAGIVCMHRDLGPADALSVGRYRQPLPLALTARGLGTCVEASVAGSPEIVRAPLAIPADLAILCGLAVGYPDPDFPANRLPISREAVGKNVVCLDSESGERSDRQGERSQTGPWPTLWGTSRRSLSNATGVGFSRMMSLVSLTFTRRRSDCFGGLSSRRPDFYARGG